MIEVKERVVVDGRPQRVWEIVSDPQAVASCIGGCQLGEQHDDGSYDATIGVKFGGIRVKFRTKVDLEVDHSTMTGQLRITGADQQGATRVGGSANFEVRATDPDRSAVEFNGALDINGKLATLIASGASVVVGRMTREFTECLSTKLALSTVPAQPAVLAPATGSAVFTDTAPTVATQADCRPHLTFMARVRQAWTKLVDRLRGTKGQH
ncbi:CoxG family protein [Flexivirga alba]|uniref:CoxG family protein n=1 Tax=Flexivirga alba TaxID=702742 RepID=A0ABW2ADQ1_9MICO